MSFHEEPESQIDPTHTQHTDDHNFPSMFNATANLQAQKQLRPLANIMESDSDDKILDVATAATSSPRSQDKVLDSQVVVEETQFVGVERDTQPLMEYDISPISRRALDNIEPVSTCLPPPMATFQPLERQNVSLVPTNSDFRFGRPPNPNGLNFARPLPGQIGPCENKMTDPMSLTTTSHSTSLSSSARSPLDETLHTRGDPPTASRNKIPYSNPPTAQINSSCVTNHGEGTSGEVNEFSPHRTASSPLDIPMMPEKVSLRMSRQFLVESTDPANSTMRAQLVATLKSNKISHQPPHSPSQPRKKAKLRSPPFIEEALESDIRHKSRQIANKLAAKGMSSYKPNDPEIPTQQEEHIQNPNCANPCSPCVSTLNDKILETGPANSPPVISRITARVLPENSSLAIFREVEVVQPQTLAEIIPDSRQALRYTPSSNKSVTSNRQSGSSSTGHGPNKPPLSHPMSRPVSDKQLPSQEVSEIHSIHDSLDAGVYKRDLNRSKSAQYMRRVDPPVNGSQPPDSAAMLQMAAILATAEKEQREQGIAKSRLQKLEIEDLRRENTGFRDRIEVLSTENRELLNKVDDFRRRNERCRTKMNEITRAHKELFPAAKALDKRRFEMLEECAREMDADLLKKKALLAGEWKSLFSEARNKLDNQDKMIEVLNRDVDNRLLDLQRERSIKESLERQLEDREKQEKELRSLLFAHQQSTIEALSGHEHMLKDLMNTGATSLMKLNECRTRIENIEESEPKPIAALKKVNELIVAMSKSIEEKLQERQDFTTDVRNAGVEVLAELKNRLQLVDEDCAVQRKLNGTIIGLHEENAKLKERIGIREREFVSLETEISELKHELQQCRAELATKTNDLGEAIVAGREVATLRTQLEDLQINYSFAKAQMESATNETERVKGNFHEQENLALLAKQETSKLQDRLEESEAKVSSFRAQKETYIRQAKSEFATLRLQMERDLQARLAEDEVSHSDNISGLRRQIVEANANVDHTNRKLQNLEKINLRHEIESNHLSTKVSAIATELTSLEEKSLLMDNGRDQIDLDLRTSQSQLGQCVGKILVLGSKTETKTREFAKRCDEIEYGLKRSEKVAETEIERLRKSLSALQKKIEDSGVVSNSIARQLYDKGTHDADLTLVEWSKQLREGFCWPEHTNGEICHITDSTCESPCPDSQDRVTSSNSRGAHRDMTEMIPNYLCAQSSVQGNSHRADQPSTIPNEARRGDSLESRQSRSSPLLSAPNENKGRNVSENENSPNTSLVAFTRESKSPGHINEHLSVQETISTSHPEPGTCLDHPKIRPSGNKRLQRNIGPVIADSQEEVAQYALSYAPRVPERQCGAPLLREAKRTITTTEHTEYSIHSSEIYRDLSMVQSDIKNGVKFGDQSFDVKYKEQEDNSYSDHESSGLSDPPDNLENFDFTEHLDDSSGQVLSKDAQAKGIAVHAALSPRPNTSRIRAGVGGKEMKPPKSILKKSNRKTGNDTCGNADPNTKQYKQAQSSKLQNNSGDGSSRRALLSTSSASSGLQSARFGSSYNRVVSGNRTSHSSNYFQVPEVVTEGKGASTTDTFAMPPSPAMGQPQRNTKKRTISEVDFSNNKRAAKVPRLVMH